jgi:DNA-binding CsgD family transcriptional regulator
LPGYGRYSLVEDRFGDTVEMSKKRTPHRATRYGLLYGGGHIGISAAEFVVGRASDCQLRLNDALVSRHHARLTETSEGLVVEDLGSRNGVLVNARKIVRLTSVCHGDMIGIGLASLEVVDDLMLHRPEHLSTMPPPPPPSGKSAVPKGEADVDAPEQETVVARVDLLTEREREVLELIVLGHTQREMAERLHLSVKTIETHRANIADKLDCHTRAELVAYAITAGILRHGALAR